MGADLSACCGGQDSSKETQIDFAPQDVKRTPVALSPSSPSGGGSSATSKKSSNRRRLQEGIEASLILQDRTKLTCLVKFDPQNECLLLSCDQKVRAIAMHDIKAILHTPDHLRRVEPSAGITDMQRCAAIHLAASGNCIPLFFTDTSDKAVFLDVVEVAKRVFDEKSGAKNSTTSVDR